VLPIVCLVRIFLGHHVLTAFLELHVAELVKDPFFTLFESVGALEVSC
jgi:hypothetical protein